MRHGCVVLVNSLEEHKSLKIWITCLNLTGRGYEDNPLGSVESSLNERSIIKEGDSKMS